MVEDPVWFTESEVADVLWVLTEATELAADASALSTLAHLEDVLRLVRDRFDPRRPEDP
jgi:hypothetical protein